jgi:hypothetical protein
MDNEVGWSRGTFGGENKYSADFDRNSERKRPLGRPTCGWEDNIKMNFQEAGWEGVDGTHLAQNWYKW